MPGPSSETRAGSPMRATSATVVMPRSFSFSDVTGPTPHSRPTGSGWRKASSPVGRDLEQAVGLGDAAGHLGQELGAGDAHRDRQPDLVPDAGAQLLGDGDRRPGDAPQPAHVEEGLVDGQPLDQRGRGAEHVEHRPARGGVGRHVGTHDHRVGAQARAPGDRPWRCAPRGPWPRSWRPAPPRPRRSPAGPADPGRRAGAPTRRTRRGPRGGSRRSRASVAGPVRSTNTCSHTGHRLGRRQSSGSPSFRMTLAGTPPTMVWSGTSPRTTDPAATTTFRPMQAPGRITEP